jgi:membrane-bound lytic murein transglycosylase A
VQGSGRVRLPDGSVMRIAYAGRNGHPYTSVGRLIVERGLATPDQMTLEPLKAFLRADSARGRELMHQNRSYVFFRHASELPPERGPVGGAGLPLTPWRSIAVDRNLWAYGLPVWIETALPLVDGASEPFRKLAVAEDTGSAIIGPARADLFHGAGDEAGRRAGALRHPMRFVVLWPRAEPLP